MNRALAAFQNSSFGFRNVPGNNKTALITDAWTSGRSITFNSNPQAGFLTRISNTALTFLHETAHRVHLIPHDNNITKKGREQSLSNDNLIVEKCFNGVFP